MKRKEERENKKEEKFENNLKKKEERRKLDEIRKHNREKKLAEKENKKRARENKRAHTASARSVDNRCPVCKVNGEELFMVQCDLCDSWWHKICCGQDVISRATDSDLEDMDFYCNSCLM